MNAAEGLHELIAGATEAEADPDRHGMEEAVLATVAAAGLGGQPLWNSLTSLDWSRSDFAAVAVALWEGLRVGLRADLVVIKDILSKANARVEDAVLTGILDGSKVKDMAVAVRYIDMMDRQDIFRRAEEAVRGYGALVAKAKEEGGETDTAVAGFLKNVIELTQRKKLSLDYPVEYEDASNFVTSLYERRTDRRDWSGLDSGFKHLNEVLNGLTEGVFILAGAPSTGKTTLAKQIADHVAQVEKTPVLFWSFEQSKEELRIKSLARLASVDSRKIMKGRADDDAWEKVDASMNEYFHGSGRWLTIIEANREDNIDRIRVASVMAKQKAGGKPILIVVDYLQIIPGGKDAPDTIRERVDWNLSELRRLSRDLKSPILVISSENRAAYAGNSKPTLAAMKESGGIEYSADLVICLWRDTKESETLTRNFGRLTERIVAYVLKNRNGELAKIKLNFTPAWARFDDEGRDPLTWSDALGSAEITEKPGRKGRKDGFTA